MEIKLIFHWQVVMVFLNIDTSRPIKLAPVVKGYMTVELLNHVELLLKL